MAAVLLLAACGGGGGGSAVVDAQVPRDGRAVDAAPAGDGAPAVDGALIDAAMPVDATVADATVADATVTDAGNPLTDAGIPPCMQLPASGGSIIMGEIKTTGPTWNRPFVDVSCPAGALSSVGTDVHYDTYVFCNSGAQRLVNIFMDGVDEQPATLTHTDPYLVIYDGAGIPADPLQCASGNDDFDMAAGKGAGVTNVTVTAGGTITVIATSYDNPDLGTYALRLNVH